MQLPLIYFDTCALLVMFDMTTQAYKTSQRLQKGLYCTDIIYVDRFSSIDQ